MDKFNRMCNLNTLTKKRFFEQLQSEMMVSNDPHMNKFIYDGINVGYEARLKNLRKYGHIVVLGFHFSFEWHHMM